MEEGLSIEIRGLTKKYKDFLAVDNVDISAKRGEIYAILGPNGAGKTTTIKSILGIVKPNRGKIKVFGKDIDQVRDRISFVPEEKTFYDNLTPRKVLKLCEHLLKFNSSKMENYLQKFRLPNKKISTFSHGMKTLLYLSISFSENAQLYIFDEPTWGLDPIMRDEVLEEIRKLTFEGKTVFYTSHILPEVEKVVDKMAIMNKGKILFEGYLDDAKDSFRKILLPKDTEIDEYTYIYRKVENDKIVLYMHNERDIEDLKKKYPQAIINNMNLEKIFQALVRGDGYAL